jgi:hypothetical protein
MAENAAALRGMSERQLDYVAGLHDKLDRVTSAVKERADGALTTAVSAGTAFGVGYFEGRYPDRNFFGLEPSVAVAVGAGGIALWSKQGTMQERVAMAGASGAIASYTYKLGREAGEKARIAATAKK